MEEDFRYMEKKKTVSVVVLILFVLMISLVMGYTLAKYVKQQGQQSELTSDVFYFSSDYLKADEAPEYKISGDSITFELYNYVDDLRINEADITYAVTVGAESAGITLSETGGTLVGNARNKQSITLSYAFGEGELRKEITVTAEGSASYVKTLSAKFTLINSASSYEIVDAEGQYFAELYIYTGDSAQDVTIQWDKAQLVIDENNDYVAGNLLEEKNAVLIENIAADTTIKILFFKKDITQNYTCAVEPFADAINIGTGAGA